MLHAALEQCGCAIPLDTVRDHLSVGYSWHTPEIAYPHATGEAWWRTLYRHLHQLYRRYEIPARRWADVDEGLRERICTAAHYTLYDDAAETLSACRELGWQNHLLSNNYPELAAVAKDLGLAPFFSSYTVSACVGYEKPRPELFRHALEQAGEPGIAVMVGDNPVADIQGGCAVGMRTILVHAPQDDDQADHCCPLLSQIPPLLQALVPLPR